MGKNKKAKNAGQAVECSVLPTMPFKITLDAQGNVGIGTGHMYVGGLLVENDDAAICAKWAQTKMATGHGSHS